PTATTRAVVATIDAEREPGCGASAAAAGSGVSLIAALFDAGPRFASRDPGHPDGLARNEAAARRHRGDDVKALLRAERVGDDRRHHRGLAAERQEPVAVRSVVAVVAPDAAQAGRAAGTRRAQAPDQLHVQRAPAARVHGEPLPARVVVRPGERLAVAPAYADPFEREERVVEQVPQLVDRRPDALPLPHRLDGQLHVRVAAEEARAVAIAADGAVDAQHHRRA